MSDFINNFLIVFKNICLFFVRLPKKTTSKQWIPLVATLPISKQSFLHGKFLRFIDPKNFQFQMISENLLFRKFS